MTEHRAGQDVVSYCGKCKMSLAHVIHAVKAGIPARVECKTCGAVHAYRPHAPGEAPQGRRYAAGPRTTTDRSAKRSRPTKAMREAEEALAEYERLLEAADTASAGPYDISRTFAEGQALIHARFGVGIVVKVSGDSKIDVHFREGVRTLVHGRA